MARPSSQRIVGTDAAIPQPPAVGTDVVASPVSTFVAPAENDISQLADALGQIHEPIAAMQNRKNELDQKKAIQEGVAAAAREKDVGLVKDNPEPPPTDAVPPAYANTYAEAYKKGLGQRLGQQAQDAYLADFSAQYQTEGFDKKKFDDQYRARELAGVTDPVLSGELGQSLDRASASADGEWTVLTQKRVTAERQSMLSSSLAPIDSNSTAQQAMDAFQQAAKDNVARGGTRTEAANALFDHMAGLSQQLGGRPDLFDVFHQEVPGLGKKLIELMPGMADKVFSEQHGAEEMQRRTVHEHTFTTRGEQIDGVNHLIEDGTLAKMSDGDAAQYLKQFTGVNGALTPYHYSAVLMRVRQQRAQMGDNAAVQYALSHGAGATLPEETAKKGIAAALDAPTGPAVGLGGNSVHQALFSAIANPQQAGNLLEPAITAMVNAHATSGVAFADETVKRVIDSAAMAIPKDGDATSPKFQTIAKLYATLSEKSKPLLNAYFDDKSRAIFSSYNRDTVNGQVDSNTAYHNAFALVDPENIKLANDRVEKDPAMRAQIKSTVDSAMSFWRRHTPFGQDVGVMPDMGALEGRAVEEGKRYVTMRPDATSTDVSDHIKQWSEANYFREPTTNQMVAVPPAYNNSATQSAITNYLGIVSGQPGNKDVNPRLVDKGNGVYDLFFYPKGVPVKVSDNVRLESIVALQTAQKTFSPAELEQLSSVRNKIEGGTATANDLRGSEDVVAKARVAGVWSTDLQQKADALAVQAAQAESLTTLEPALRTAVGRGDYNVTAAIKPNGSLTTPTAQQFVNTGNLAGALTTMGEGVRTTAYKDASGHQTIGIGYNLTANEKTVSEDFRRAGIPVAQIDDIKAGKRQITVEQAMRLYQAVQPRYQTIAQSAVEERYPGEWSKLGANVQAVLTDLAYQTGNVKQFKVGLDKLFQGDLSGTGLETRYKNAAGGQYTIDQRRHSLRTAMLASTTLFQTILSHASSQPANAVQSARFARAGTP